MTAARAIAHPNFALAKYWGKAPGSVSSRETTRTSAVLRSAAFENVPAVPSLSITVDAIFTTTTVRFEKGLGSDVLVLGGAPQYGDKAKRAFALIDRVRLAAGLSTRVRIDTTNSFPTGSGLASSASGFAALGLAATKAAGLDWDASRISDLVRRESASAARSLFGGYVELVPKREPFLAALPIEAPRAPALSVVVCVVTEEEKSVSSGAGMRATAETSPYFLSWLEFAIRNYRDQRDALLQGSFEKMGELAEASALAMHATALAAGLVYWSGTTLALIHAVRALRASGVPAYFTIDAGPHVKVLVPRAYEERVASTLAHVPGVLRTINTRPGGAPSVEIVP